MSLNTQNINIYIFIFTHSMEIQPIFFCDIFQKLLDEIFYPFQQDRTFLQATFSSLKQFLPYVAILKALLSRHC